MRKLCIAAFSAALVFTGVAVAQQADIPLRNWTVPPYTSSSSGGIHTMTDVTSPRLFVGIAVCRLLDTRPPANNPLDGDGAYGPDAIRTYTLTGACGIPVGADAVSLNLTVTNTGNHPFGHLKVWPAAQAEPNVSTLNWSTGGVTESNAAIVALSAGQIKIKTGNIGADVIMDVNGYFSDTLTDGENFLELYNNSTLYTAYFENSNAGCVQQCGVVAAVAGGWAIYGTSPFDIGVRGDSGTYNGVWAQSGTHDALAAFGGRDGGYLQGARHGVIGASVATTGLNYGVLGATNSGSNDVAGVVGVADLDSNPVITSQVHTLSGVRGVSSGFGVLGFGEYTGVRGVLVDSAGTTIASGNVASSTGVDAGGAAPWSFFGFMGDIGTTFAKSFVEPHPTDASKILAYISLEGPEPGTYFRGRGKFENGIARIPVPDHFRMVTDPEGLTVQITPIGAMATVAVMRMDLDEIVVQASRNVEFSYLVQGVRSAFKDSRAPIRTSGLFAPESPHAKLPQGLAEEHKRRLIQNGTYNADGTANMETAHRLGWDKVWEKRNPPAPAPSPE